MAGNRNRGAWGGRGCGGRGVLPKTCARRGDGRGARREGAARCRALPARPRGARQRCPDPGGRGARRAVPCSFLPGCIAPVHRPIALLHCPGASPRCITPIHHPAAGASAASNAAGAAPGSHRDPRSATPCPIPRCSTSPASQPCPLPARCRAGFGSVRVLAVLAAAADTGGTRGDVKRGAGGGQGGMPAWLCREHIGLAVSRPPGSSQVLG